MENHYYLGSVYRLPGVRYSQDTKASQKRRVRANVSPASEQVSGAGPRRDTAACDRSGSRPRLPHAGGRAVAPRQDLGPSPRPPGAAGCGLEHRCEGRAPCSPRQRGEGRGTAGQSQSAAPHSGLRSRNANSSRSFISLRCFLWVDKVNTPFQKGCT